MLSITPALRYSALQVLAMYLAGEYCPASLICYHRPTSLSTIFSRMVTKCFLNFHQAKLISGLTELL